MKYSAGLVRSKVNPSFSGFHGKGTCVQDRGAPHIINYCLPF